MPRKIHLDIPDAQLQADMQQWTDSVLAKRYGIPQNLISVWRRQWGIDALSGLRRATTPRLHEQLLTILLQPTGARTYRALAQQLGVSYQAIQYAFETLERRGLARASARPVWGRRWVLTKAARGACKTHPLLGDITPSIHEAETDEIS